MTKLLIPLFVSTLAVSTLTISAESRAFNGDAPYIIAPYVEASYIEVKGQASVLAIPDHFSLTIVIAERGRLTDKIRMVVDNKTNQVVQIAKNLGVKKHDINSARVTLKVIKSKPSITIEGLDLSQRTLNGVFSKNQDNKVHAGTKIATSTANKQNNIKPRYFELNRTISINFSNIKYYDQFLSHVIKLGISHIYPLAMSVENTEKYYQQALTQAITNAKNKASNIATHSNVTLDKLLFVKELSSNYYRPRMSSRVMSAEIASDHTSEVSNQVINASVLVKFSIQE